MGFPSNRPISTVELSEKVKTKYYIEYAILKCPVNNDIPFFALIPFKKCVGRCKQETGGYTFCIYKK